MISFLRNMTLAGCIAVSIGRLLTTSPATGDDANSLVVDDVCCQQPPRPSVHNATTMTVRFNANAECSRLNDSYSVRNPGFRMMYTCHNETETPCKVPGSER